ncbi:hypothetical protein ABT189_17880 [Streptomyces sp900105755]|uniref:hypothetical protein n=1 Tax=Streptomyces sp. 900105755 TaxID=3154389 RepID=UPI003332BC86
MFRRQRGADGEIVHDFTDPELDTRMGYSPPRRSRGPPLPIPPKSPSRVEVSDTRSDRLPVARGAGGCEERGRGLALVAPPAKEWGTTPRPGAPGRTVGAVVTS